MALRMEVGGKTDIVLVRQGLRMLLSQAADDAGLTSQIQALIDRSDNVLAGVSQADQPRAGEDREPPEPATATNERVPQPLTAETVAAGRATDPPQEASGDPEKDDNKDGLPADSDAGEGTTAAKKKKASRRKKGK